MARQRNGPKRLATAARMGSSAAVNRASPGRPPGSPNRRTLAGCSLLRALEAGDEGAGLPTGFDRMKRLLNDPDARVRLGAERLVLLLLHGRPVAGDGEPGEGSTIDTAGLGMRAAKTLLAELLERDPGALDGAPEEPETARWSRGPLPHAPLPVSSSLHALAQAEFESAARLGLVPTETSPRIEKTYDWRAPSHERAP